MMAYKIARKAHFPDAWREESYDLAIVFPQEHIIIPYSPWHLIMLEHNTKNSFSLLDNARSFKKKDGFGLEELPVLTSSEWAEYMNESDVLKRNYNMQEVEVDDRIVKILKQKISLDKRKEVVDKRLKEIIKGNLIGNMN